jgi:hypothetical protein
MDTYDYVTDDRQGFADLQMWADYTSPDDEGDN